MVILGLSNYTTDNKSKLIPSDEKQTFPFCRLKSLNTDSLEQTNQNSTISIQSFLANGCDNMVIKLWEPMYLTV